MSESSIYYAHTDYWFHRNGLFGTQLFDHKPKSLLYIVYLYTCIYISFVVISKMVRDGANLIIGEIWLPPLKVIASSAKQDNFFGTSAL